MTRSIAIFLLAWAAAAVGFADTTSRAVGPRFDIEPVVAPNPNPAVPLAAVVKFETDEPVETTLAVSDGTHHWEFSYDASRDPAQGLPVVGFRPDTEHSISVTIADGQGNRRTVDGLTFHSPALPDDPAEFPSIEVVAQNAEKLESCFRLFNPRRRIPRQTQAGNEEERRFGESFGMLLMVDPAGTPVWYYRTDSRIAGFDYLDNGHLLYVTADYRLVEIDLLGNTVRSWYAARRPQGPTDDATAVDALTFHHDADRLANGNILALSTDRRMIEDYYTSEYDRSAPRKDQWVMGDRVVEFTPSGRIVWSWNAFDHLPERRLGYETFLNYWQRRGFPETIDWSHANAVGRLDDGSVLINFRYQSAVVKVDTASGEIKWIFGEPSGWPESLQTKLIRLEAGTRWPWHQHAPVVTDRGTMLLFDNGNYRARPFEEPTPVAETWSRAVEYEIDEKSRTARQVWTSETADQQRVVTIAMGSVAETPRRENILVGYGAILDPDRIGQITWRNRAQFQQETRCREYTHTEPAEVVWDLRLLPTGRDPRISWNLFGCQPVSKLRP